VPPRRISAPRSDNFLGWQRILAPPLPLDSTPFCHPAVAAYRVAGSLEVGSRGTFIAAPSSQGDRPPALHCVAAL